ncbi:MAG TPA: FHA domain-containing protein, partial [Tepidisphaeraceae bacterium]|nr:FHA domain-containing protein [Tepidisphaeraceae bacterium]
MAASPLANSRNPGPGLQPTGAHQNKPLIQLLRPVWVIGSRSNARLHLVSHTVSKAHALLVRSNGRFYIRDLASRAGTLINGEGIHEADLTDGDQIQIGSFSFQFIAGEDEGRPRRIVETELAKLEVTGSDYPLPLDQRVLLIGRRSACDIHLLEETVSIAHAVIFEMDGRWFVRDLGSRTGTYVNGVSTHQHRLSFGDLIHIGDTDLRFMPNEVAPAIVVDEDTLDADKPELTPLEAPEEFHVSQPLPQGAEMIPAVFAPLPVLEPESSSAPAEVCLAAPAEPPPKFVEGTIVDDELEEIVQTPAAPEPVKVVAAEVVSPPPVVEPVQEKPAELPPLQPIAVEMLSAPVVENESAAALQLESLQSELEPIDSSAAVASPSLDLKPDDAEAIPPVASERP